MITDNFCVAILILASTTGVLSIIMYMSVISPGYIEFDDRSRREMKIMNTYNIVMDTSFKVYLCTEILSTILTIETGNMVFMSVAIYIDFIYFTVAVFFMIILYGRSRLYWIRKERGDSSQGCFM